MNTNRAKSGMLVCAVLIGLGSLLPWAVVTAPLLGTVNMAGMEGDGKVTLILAVGALMIGLMDIKGAAIVSMAAMLIAGLIGINAVINVSNAANELQAESNALNFEVSVSVGLGLWLVVLGAIFGVAATFFRLASTPVPA